MTAPLSAETALPLVSERLHHAVARRLAMAIVGGDLPAGHVFPAEVEHAERLGVSRSVLREAFRVLTSKGMVSSRPKAGTRVNERKSWNLLDPDVLPGRSSAVPATNSCATCSNCAWSSSRRRRKWRRCAATIGN